MVVAAAWVFACGCDRVFDVQHITIDDGGQVLEADARIDASHGEGLVAWYSLDTLTATTVADDTAHGHDAMCLGACPTVVTGRVGTALQFAGNGVLLIQDAPELRLSTGFTVAAWVKFDALPAPGRVVCAFSQTRPDAYNTWQLCVNSSKQLKFYSHDGRIDQDFTGPELTFGRWSYLAIAWDPVDNREVIYLNGGRTIGPEVAIAFIPGNIALGGDLYIPPQTPPQTTTEIADAPMTGVLDDVRIYNRALSDSELDALMTP